jgi:glycopeptide antibiotics resistance protein
MDAYFFPISTAVWQFPIIAALLTLPYAIYSYRKYGAVSAYRSLVLVSMLFYLQCVLYLVVLPLPDPQEVAKMTGPYAELIPFRNVYEFIMKSSFDITRVSTWIPALREPYFLEPVFNLLLTLPFGFYLSYYFKSNLKKVIAFSFLLSLFCELTQLTGLFFLYPRPYRLFDVNDLMLNTLGGMCGYFIYTRFLRMLPSKRSIDERSRERSKKVGFTRRLVSFMIDSLLVSLIGALLSFAAGFNPLYIYIFSFFAYYIAFACLLRGRTPGKTVVKIRIEREDGLNSASSLMPAICARYLARNTFLLAIQFADCAIRHPAPQYGIFANAALFLVLAAAFADVLLSFRRDRRLWYELLSKTRNVSYFHGGSARPDADK